MDRSRGRSIGYSEDPECKIFIRNIPIEMEQEGLQNIFSTVGQIESCRIIPTKEPSHTATFGYIQRSLIDLLKQNFKFDINI